MKYDSKRAIKIDFPRHVREEFIKMANTIVTYIKSTCQANQQLSTFTIDQYDDGITKAYKAYTVDNGNKIISENIDTITWEDLIIRIPGLLDFCNKYKLEPAFTLAECIDAPPHRHYHTPTSMWSISMFLGDCSGTIKFFENKEPIGAIAVDKMIRDLDRWNCSEQIKSQPGDFYSINTWLWHGWRADDLSKPSLITLFYLRNTSSYKQASDHIIQIKNNN